MPVRWFETYRWWWCALSGILLVLGFAPFACAACGWIALVPAWLVITYSETVRRKPLRHGYLIGLIYFAGTFWWISDVTLLGTVLLILYVSFYPGIWFLLIARMLDRWRDRRNPAFILLQAFAAASFWVMLEWWRSWFLTGFDWDELGATQSPSVVFRQLAAFGGVPLISFVLVFVNVLWVEGIVSTVEEFGRTRALRVSLPLQAALLIVAFCFALGMHHLRRHHSEMLSAPLTYACIQPDVVPAITTDDSWDAIALKKQVDLTMRALKSNPDLIVWPEAILDEGVFQDRPLNEAVRSICQNNSGYFLLGSQDYEVDPASVPSPGKRPSFKLYNCAYFFGPRGDQYDYYYKTRLVVWGEYLPLGDVIPGFRKWVGMGMDFSTGPGPKKFNLAQPAVSFSPLICFEDTLAEVPDKAARLNPDFFVDISNDAWYTGWFAAWGVRQHLNLARFRCVEHDRAMLRCTNNGITCEIDQNGTVTDRLRNTAGASIDTAGIFTGKLQFYPAHRTLYESWGNWIVLLSSVVSVIIAVYFFCRPPRSRES